MDRENESAHASGELAQAQGKSTGVVFEENDAAALSDRKPSLQPYLDADLQLIPLHKWDSIDARGRARGKTPREGSWQRRTYDSEQVATDAIERGHNVGVRLPSTVVVLDVDPRNFAEGLNSLLSLQLATGLSLRGVPHTKTGSGGDHFWFSKDDAITLLDSLPQFPGLEFKSAGRQVVAAGSRHPNGTVYAWANVPDLRNLPPLPPEVLALALRPAPKNATALESGEFTGEQLESMLDSLDPCDYGDHDEWLKLMMACHHATDGEGRDEFITWSTGDPAYSDQAWVIGSRWDSLHTDGTSRGGRPITAKHLFKQVLVAGGTIPKSEPEDDFEVMPLEARSMQLQVGRGEKTTFSNCIKLLAQLQDQLGLAYDEFGRAERLNAPQLPWSVDIGRTLDDAVMRRIRQYLVVQTEMNWSKEDVSEAVLTLVREHPYHPVRDYLASLAWDGVPRLDNLLRTYAGASDNAYVRAIGAKTLIAAVRRVRQPGCKFDSVIVLEGHQGCGKSSFVKLLSPEVEWFSDAPIGNTEAKDAPLSLQGKWIVELGEMSVLGKSGVEALKAFVSCSIDHVRRPYARFHEEMRRQCVFIGTTNHDQYLKDQTGNRRFWPVRVGKVDLEQLVLDRDQLWAEAAARESEGESLVLASELWPMAAAEQMDRVASDPWADTLRAWLDGSAISGPEDRLDRAHATTLLTEALGIHGYKQTVADSQRLKVVMTTELGWLYTKNVRAGQEKKQGCGYTRQ